MCAFGVSFVFHLLGASRPATIFRRVVAVIVDAVNRQFFRRTATHIGQEVGIRSAPTFADGNASASPQVEFRIVSIFAAFNHSCPSGIFSRAFTSARFPVSSRTFGCSFSLKTSATTMFSESQVATTGCDISSAKALAFPSWFTTKPSVLFNYGQPMYLSTSKVDECWHGMRLSYIAR